jgi:hypothetical protein
MLAVTGVLEWPSCDREDVQPISGTRLQVNPTPNYGAFCQGFLDKYCGSRIAGFRIFA